MFGDKKDQMFTILVHDASTWEEAKRALQLAQRMVPTERWNDYQITRLEWFTARNDMLERRGKPLMPPEEVVITVNSLSAILRSHEVPNIVVRVFGEKPERYHGIDVDIHPNEFVKVNTDEELIAVIETAMARKGRSDLIYKVNLASPALGLDTGNRHKPLHDNVAMVKAAVAGVLKGWAYQGEAQ